MKIDRQIGILSVLLQRETVTAPYLAEKFEVSHRTINRDIEDLCKAGMHCIPKLQAIFSGHRKANSALLLETLSFTKIIQGKVSGGTGRGIDSR